MDTVTHALAPVIIAHVCMSRSTRFGRAGLIAIGVAGALPDILSPHLSLEARMTSWSHGLPFWVALTTCLVIASLVSQRRFPLRLSLALSLAYLFHLICDAISGGINWLYPVSDFIWGEYWVSPIFWIPLDIVCVLLCYYLFRLRPLLRKSKSRTSDVLK